EQPNAEHANQLIELYAEYVQNNPNDVDENARLLQKSARLYKDNKEYIKAAGILVMAIKQFFVSTSTAENIIELATIYQDNLDNQEAYIATLNGFLNAFPDHEAAEEISIELGETRVNITEHMIDLGTAIFETPDGSPGFDPDAANRYIGHSELYAMTNGGNSELASELLMKAASVARTGNSYTKALEFYQWISQIYPETDAGKKALFLHAFTLDNDMGKKEEAKPLYEQFIAAHPEHSFADDAEFQLKNLGKSSSEIIDAFEKEPNTSN
ncbi:MAG: tetratricopeptide repeat protein, partial [Bacteroidia bacterium]|nr:tetratricopeptide repeat protein [Bacteroidia bacterium]